MDRSNLKILFPFGERNSIARSISKNLTFYFKYPDCHDALFMTRYNYLRGYKICITDKTINEGLILKSLNDLRIPHIFYDNIFDKPHFIHIY